MSNIPELLRDLSSFIDHLRRVRARPGRMFGLAARAAVAKAYDFATYVHTEKVVGAGAFVAPTLRGICEDAIVLGFVVRMPRSDRERLIGSLMTLEVLNNITAQASFFAAARPFQAVLQPQQSTPAKIEALERDAREVWLRHGWSLNRGAMPQVRQLADRQGQAVLATAYEFLYRLTSGLVHFNPGVLLRSGWGDEQTFSFAPTNFDQYYVAIARIYSVYLLCLHFELLSRFVRPSPNVAALVRSLRFELRVEERWPENDHIRGDERHASEVPRG